MRPLLAILLIGIIGIAIVGLASGDALLVGIATGLLVLLLIFQRVKVFGHRRPQPPRSQIAEVERLYFRAVREMLNVDPSYAQVTNDLQRVLTIDSRYKNARHYLQCAIVLQQDSGQLVAGYANGKQVDFYTLQDRLIEEDPGVRKSVIMDLIRFGERAVDPLTALLMDEDADVRVHAATALGWVGGEAAVHPLLVALEDADVQVRRYAARAMCWVVNETAVAGLIVALDDDDNYVCCYAARALGWSQDRRAIEPLNDLLSHDNADVREYAVTALLDLGEQIAT